MALTSKKNTQNQLWSVKSLCNNAVESQLHSVFFRFHYRLGTQQQPWQGPPLGWSTVVSVSMSTAKAEPKVLQPGGLCGPWLWTKLVKFWKDLKSEPHHLWYSCPAIAGEGLGLSQIQTGYTAPIPMAENTMFFIVEWSEIALSLDFETTLTWVGLQLD